MKRETTQPQAEEHPNGPPPDKPVRNIHWAWATALVVAWVSVIVFVYVVTNGVVY